MLIYPRHYLRVTKAALIARTVLELKRSALAIAEFAPFDRKISMGGLW